jgi:hypothetical protein
MITRITAAMRASRRLNADHAACPSIMVPRPELAIRCPHLARRLTLAAAAYRLAPSGRQLLAEVAPVRRVAEAVQGLRVRAGLGGVSKPLVAHSPAASGEAACRGRQLVRRNAPMAAMESSCVVMV